MTAAHPKRSLYFWRQLLGWCWLFGLIALPLRFDPLRLESFESPKATFAILTGIGIGCAALMLWRLHSIPLRQHWLRNPLTLAVMIWGIVAALSAVLSLSPARSLFGDVYRRMGAITQVSLLMAFVGGSLLARRQRDLTGPMLAIVGLLVAGYGILERLGLSPFVADPAVRPSSTLGVHVRAASWCIIVILWLLVFMLSRRKPTWLYLLSLIACAVFLLLTQSRGAALGLIVGLLTLGVLWAFTHRRRWLIGLIAVGSSAILITGISLYMLDLRGSTLANLPLIGRLSAVTDGETSVFRLLLWRSVSKVVTTWPTLNAVTDQAVEQPDRFGMLRPLIGYGQEMFEIAEHQVFDGELQATDPAHQLIDRAHNLELDTLVTQGFLGVLALGAVVAAAGWMGLRILRQQGHTWDERGWIAALALSVLVAHLVDLQFTFATVASEWLFWAVLGWLLNAALCPSVATFPDRPDTQPSWTIGLTLTSGVFAWSAISSPIPDHALIMLGCLTAGLALLAVSGATTRSTLPVIAVAVGAVVLHAVMDSPTPKRLLVMQAVFLVAIGLILVAALWSQRRRFPRRAIALWIVVMFAVGGWYVLDATADSIYKLAQQQTDPGQQVDLAITAVTLKPYDDRLHNYASNTVLWAGSNIPGDAQQEWLQTAVDLMNQASVLNAYDATLTVQRAYYYAYLSLDSADQRQTYLEQADHFYMLAAHQWPTDGGLMLEWARFVLTFRHEPERAIKLAEQAQQLSPGRAADAQQVISDAQQ